MRKYTFIIFLCLAQISFAQNNKQKISGVITDKLSQTTLPGAAVQIISTADKKGTTSDSNGNYVLSDVSPERYELKITYLGYKDVLVSNIVVTSGKETILDIEMEEKVTDLNEVVVTANSKEKTINNLIPGLEATTEGPINKEKGSSYLVGYRCALAGVAQTIGVDIGTTALPSYQDLSFNVNSGTSKLGRFTMFGILATSSINIEGGTSGSLYGSEGGGHDLGSQIGIVGLKHFKQLNSKSYFSSNIGLNYSNSEQSDYGFDRQTSVSKSISTTYQLGFFPNFVYKIQF